MSPVVGSCDVPGCGSFRPSGWMRPTAMMASSPTMKTIVGSRKARAVSPRPRRLSTVMKSEDPEAQRDRCPVERREGGLERRDAGGDGDGDRERVVDDQCGGGDRLVCAPKFARDTA